MSKLSKYPATPVAYLTALTQMQQKCLKREKKLVATIKSHEASGDTGHGLAGWLKANRLIWETLAAERKRVYIRLERALPLAE